MMSVESVCRNGLEFADHRAVEHADEPSDDEDDDEAERRTPDDAPAARTVAEQHAGEHG